MHALALDGVEVAFGTRAVLRGLGLRISPGEVVAISGANGAGKSTLLRVAAALVVPQTGRVRVLGIDAVRAVRAGYVAWCGGGDSAWTRRLTLRASLAFHGRLRGRSGREIHASIEEWAARLGFADHLDERAERCSSGIRQRAALARALLGRPRLLLLDEPLRGVDAASALQLATAVRARLGDAAALWVSHDAAELRAVGDRRLVLEQGRLAAPAPPRLACVA
jgi:ABC-type multidrug transport system ATPase subunit